MHDSLSAGLSESILKLGSVVLGKVVANEGLSSVLVNTLENLVSGSVSKSREEREELLSGGGGGVVLEDNGLKLGKSGNLGLVAHKTLRDGVDLKVPLLVNKESMQQPVAAGNTKGSNIRGGRQQAQRYRQILSPKISSARPDAITENPYRNREHERWWTPSCWTTGETFLAVCDARDGLGKVRQRRRQMHGGEKRGAKVFVESPDLASDIKRHREKKFDRATAESHAMALSASTKPDWLNAVSNQNW